MALAGRAGAADPGAGATGVNGLPAGTAEPPPAGESPGGRPGGSVVEGTALDATLVLAKLPCGKVVAFADSPLAARSTACDWALSELPVAEVRVLPAPITAGYAPPERPATKTPFVVTVPGELVPPEAG